MMCHRTTLIHLKPLGVLLLMLGCAPAEDSALSETRVVLADHGLAPVSELSGELKRASDAVVRLALPPYVRGTGFFVSGDGYFLTNDHVAGHGLCPANCTALVVQLGVEQGAVRRTISGATLVFSDPQLDVALFKVEVSEPVSWIPLTAKTRRGPDPVERTVIGHPFGALKVYHRGEGAEGPGPDDELISNFRTYGGNSGSPVLSDAGEATGLVWGGYVTTDRTHLVDMADILAAYPVLAQVSQETAPSVDEVRAAVPPMVRPLHTDEIKAQLAQSATGGEPAAGGEAAAGGESAAPGIYAAYPLLARLSAGPPDAVALEHLLQTFDATVRVYDRDDAAFLLARLGHQLGDAATPAQRQDIVTRLAGHVADVLQVELGGDEPVGRWLASALIELSSTAAALAAHDLAAPQITAIIDDWAAGEDVDLSPGELAWLRLANGVSTDPDADLHELETTSPDELTDLSDWAVALRILRHYPSRSAALARVVDRTREYAELGSAPWVVPGEALSSWRADLLLALQRVRDEIDEDRVFDGL